MWLKLWRAFRGVVLCHVHSQTGIKLLFLHYTYSPGWNSSNPPSSLRGALSISPLSCCSLSDTVNIKIKHNDYKCEILNIPSQILYKFLHYGSQCDQIFIKKSNIFMLMFNLWNINVPLLLLGINIFRTKYIISHILSGAVQC